MLALTRLYIYQHLLLPMGPLKGEKGLDPAHTQQCIEISFHVEIAYIRGKLFLINLKSFHKLFRI